MPEKDPNPRIVQKEKKSIFTTIGRYGRDAGWLLLNKKQKQERLNFAVNLIKDLPVTHARISYVGIGDKIGYPGVPFPKIVKMVERLIKDGEIDAHIDEGVVIFQKHSLEITLPPDTQELLEIIKSNTEDIKSDLDAYIALIEQMFDKQENLEEFLRERLAADFAKIKDAWQQFKAGEINRRELIKKGMAVFGKKFVKIIVRKG